MLLLAQTLDILAATGSTVITNPYLPVDLIPALLVPVSVRPIGKWHGQSLRCQIDGFSSDQRRQACPDSLPLAWRQHRKLIQDVLCKVFAAGWIGIVNGEDANSSEIHRAQPSSVAAHRLMHPALCLVPTPLAFLALGDWASREHTRKVTGRTSGDNRASDAPADCAQEAHEDESNREPRHQVPGHLIHAPAADAARPGEL